MSAPRSKSTKRRWEDEDLIFLDEFGINLAMTRAYARASRGERALVTEPFHHGGNISVISAMGRARCLCPHDD